ncbi:MAG: YggS family pyridoxal phosphate-dependent enzyme [Gammaproteobacteria bacterium]|nr:YggS family pyridoxal phosphate-dependent enzyme [Gammaproteobacteria bacterium]
MVAVRLAEIETRIRRAAARSGRNRADITLVAIGKTHPAAVLQAAYDAGQRVFGENRAQELVGKVGQLPGDIEWHFVGHLQRNKVRLVRPIVSLLHSMDSVTLGAAWLKGPGLAPPVLIEVNIGGEPQKPGVPIEMVDEVTDHLMALGVDVRGLMAVPPIAQDAEQVRPYFRELATLRTRLAERWPSITELSMGMTDDFEVAIEEGSTMIRLGRAIFGSRMTKGVV